MKISEIKSEEIKAMALANQYNDLGFNDETMIVGLSFNYVDSREGEDFWQTIFNGNTPELTPTIKSHYPDIFPPEIEGLTPTYATIEKTPTTVTEGIEEKELDYSIKYNDLSLSSPEEMANTLRVTFLILPEEFPALEQWKFSEINKLVNLMALRMSSFLNQNKKRYPKGYWEDVCSNLKNKINQYENIANGYNKQIKAISIYTVNKK